MIHDTDEDLIVALGVCIRDFGLLELKPDTFNSMQRERLYKRYDEIILEIVRRTDIYLEENKEKWSKLTKPEK